MESCAPQPSPITHQRCFAKLNRNQEDIAPGDENYPSIEMPEQGMASLRSRRLVMLLCSLTSCSVSAFQVQRSPYVVGNSLAPKSRLARSRQNTRISLFAPPGSGYARPEDEKSELPDSYDPMMEYPGTMRPGRTPENMPFHDLPIADTDPDPVPWPHFQQIEWHHRWDPPHPHPIPMEDFIEQEGRWATPEMEAAMRAGNRRDARRRREMEEEQKRETLIMDDDEDDQDEPQDLGEGMFGQLGSAADQALTAAATSPDAEVQVDDVKDEDVDVDAGLDDFLLDLGLDSFGDDDDDVGEAETAPVAKAPIGGLEDVVVGDDDEDEGTETTPDTGITASIDVDDDDLELGLDEEDDLADDGVSTVPLEDFGDGDSLDSEEFFDDGGFDYDDGDFDSDGGDMW